MNKTSLFFLLIVSFYSMYGQQQSGFVIDINDTVYEQGPTNFIQNKHGGYVGAVNKNWIGCDVYSITAEGDTMSVSITKPDTSMWFGEIINVKANNYDYLLNGFGKHSEGTMTHPFTIFYALDSNLQIVWEKIYNFNFFYSAPYSRVIQLKDSNFLYVCSPHMNEYMFLFKMSLNGDSMNYRLYDGDSAGQIMSITYNVDSTNLLLHTMYAYYDPLGPQSECMVLDEDWNQTEVWFYPRWLRNPYTALLLPDGNILNGATFKNAYNGMITAYKMKADSTFEPLRINKLTDPDTNTQAAANISIDYKINGQYFIGGAINIRYIDEDVPSWFYVAMLNDTLGVEYEKYIGGDAYYWLFSVTATTDGGVLLVGTRHEFGADEYHRGVRIIKLDSITDIVHVSEKQIPVYDIIVYPNPGNNVLYVRTALKNCSFLMYSSNGKLLIEESLDNLVTNIRTNKLKRGTYIYKVIQNNTVINTGKWIKIKN